MKVPIIKGGVGGCPTNQGCCYLVGSDLQAMVVVSGELGDTLGEIQIVRHVTSRQKYRLNLTRARDLTELS